MSKGKTTKDQQEATVKQRPQLNAAHALSMDRGQPSNSSIPVSQALTRQQEMELARRVVWHG